MSLDQARFVIFATYLSIFNQKLKQQKPLGLSFIFTLAPITNYGYVQGWHLDNLTRARQEPLKIPNSSIDSMAY